MIDWAKAPNFSPKEFECKGKGCCDRSALPKPELVYALQKLRKSVSEYNQASTPLKITSGVRCQKHNDSVGGSPNSQHLLGKAADVKTPKGMTPSMLAKIAEDTVEEFRDGGIGVYESKGFVHFDIGKKRRWRL